jgi:hypothetical protein
VSIGPQLYEQKSEAGGTFAVVTSERKRGKMWILLTVKRRENWITVVLEESQKEKQGKK